MLNRKSAEVGTLETSAAARVELSYLERRLIAFYRRLSQREQDQLRRLTEVLGAHPESVEDN